MTVRQTTCLYPAKARVPPLHRWLHAARKQIPLLRKLTVRLYLPLALLYTALALQGAVPIDVLLRDAHAEALGDSEAAELFYRGALSNLGVLLWWAAAVVSAFSWMLLGTSPRGGTSFGDSRPFLLYLTLFSAILSLDDLFMLHEEALPNYLGIPELAVYLCYGVLALGFVRFTPFIFRTNFLLLALALSFFAFSVLTDYGMLRFLFAMPSRADLVIEDLCKALGIVSWLGYVLQTARRQVALRFQP